MKFIRKYNSLVSKILCVSLFLMAIFSIEDTCAKDFYIDPDYQGSMKDGSAEHPWNRLSSQEWTYVDADLADNDVVVYFSAREADAETNQMSYTQVSIYREDQSTHRVTLDGMTKYNSDDTNPLWKEYNGSSRFQVMDDYPMSTSNKKRNYVTVRGFKLVAGVNGRGGQVIYYWGGDHVIIEKCEIMHHLNAVHGATLQFGYAYAEDGSIQNGGCVDLIIRNNLIHDTYGEAIYLGGSADSGFPAHDGILVENNVIYNAGIYGGQGDAIDPKDGITNLVIRNNYCHHGYGESNVNGIPSSSAMIAEGNIIHDYPNKGISLGTYWGRGFSGSAIRNNLIYNCGNDGIYVSNSQDRPISDVEIANNTVYNNVANGLTIGDADGGLTDIRIFNNIFVNNGNGVGGWGKASYSFSNNLVFGNGKNYSGFISDQTGINGNISLDPGFYNVLNNDFHLLAESPCVDTGMEGSFEFDIEGTHRPQEVRWDIGAYEYYTGYTPDPLNEKLYCDINGDGKVDVFDIQACVNHILDMQDWRESADVDGSGNIDIVDVQIIINTILQ